MLSKIFGHLGLKRYKGMVVIYLYNEQGQKVAEIAKPEFEPLFSFWLFLAVVLPGLAILGHYG